MAIDCRRTSTRLRQYASTWLNGIVALNVLDATEEETNQERALHNTIQVKRIGPTRDRYVRPRGRF